MDADDLGRMLGWEFSLMTATVRLINCGLLDELPTLKIHFSHFAGGIGRYLGRIRGFQQRDKWGTAQIARHGRRPRQAFDYYLDHRLYYDIAGWAGPDHAAEWGADWVRFGLDELSFSQLVFATDYPQAVREPAEVAGYVEAVRALGGNGRALTAGVNAEKLIPDIGETACGAPGRDEGAGMNDKVTTDGETFDPAANGWDRVTAHNFGELIGPVWRKGDGLFGIVTADKHGIIAACCMAACLMTFRRSGHGHDRAARHRRQAARHHRDEHAVHRRRGDRRFRRSALRSGAHHAIGPVHRIQAQGRRPRSWRRRAASGRYWGSDNSSPNAGRDYARNFASVPPFITAPGSGWPTTSSASLAHSISASRSIPVSIPSSSHMKTRSSVQTLPAAPA